MYNANTLWAIAKTLGGKKYHVKALTELLPTLEPERHDNRTGAEVKDSVIRTLKGLAKGEGGKHGSIYTQRTPDAGQKPV